MPPAASGDLWREFEHDPRSPSHAPMRASDADRDVVRRVLVDAFAEGRLDHDELDERTDSVNHAKTLGELPPLLADLVPAAAVTPYGTTSLSTRELDAQALARWEQTRRQALISWLTPTLICWVVWAATMFGGFPWPVFPMVATFIPVLTAHTRKQDIVEAHRRSIMKKQEKELRRQQRMRPPELGS